MKVSELGEFGLIELLAGILGSPDCDVLVGIGDDAAAWHNEAAIQVATTDALVQDIHFTLNTVSWHDLGWKALAANLSDIAAMGGVPKHALVALGLPGETEVDDVAELYRGMRELGESFGVHVVGGDVVGAPLVMLSLAVHGTAERLLTRSAARHGDCIAVTGLLGASSAGLLMLQRGLHVDEATAEVLREAHVRPFPRVAEGQILARSDVAAAIDISDGLVGDLSRLCKASGVGARVFTEEVPVHPAVRSTFQAEYLSLALSGGEDYELLFTGSNEAIATVKGLMPCPVSIIGEITGREPGTVKLLDGKGDELRLERVGWEHFGPGKEDASRH
ncbi:MAG: thiamine-phosphate kinase [Chloroflexota bacterium]|nr:thiamine-phosphate kinase [Chloroflexota bacterium]